MVLKRQATVAKVSYSCRQNCNILARILNNKASEVGVWKETDRELRGSGDGETDNAGRSGVFQGGGACGHCSPSGHKVIYEQHPQATGWEDGLEVALHVVPTFFPRGGPKLGRGVDGPDEQARFHWDADDLAQLRGEQFRLVESP